MNQGESLWYAQARAQGRLAAFPSAGQWEQLARLGDFNLLVQQARHSSWLQSMLKPIGADVNADRIEVEIRQGYRALVEELSGWLPQCWRPAFEWTAWLVELPAIEHLLSGGAPPVWMTRDRLLAPIANAPPNERAGAIRAGVCKPLVAAPGTDPFSSWLLHWRALSREAGGIDPRCETRALAYRESIESHPMGPGWTDSAVALERDCLRIFRRRAGTIEAMLAFLALAWMVLVRFRGLLLQRLLFSGQGASQC